MKSPTKSPAGGGRERVLVLLRQLLMGPACRACRYGNIAMFTAAVLPSRVEHSYIAVKGVLAIPRIHLVVRIAHPA